MARVLIVAEHALGRLNPATAKCVSCARAIPGAEIDVAVFAADGAAVAAQAAQISGVARVPAGRSRARRAVCRSPAPGRGAGRR